VQLDHTIRALDDTHARAHAVKTAAPAQTRGQLECPAIN
jgi:hypothetical protein